MNKAEVAFTIATSNDSEDDKVKKIKKLNLSKEEKDMLSKRINKMLTNERIKKLFKGKLTTEDINMKIDELFEGELLEKVNVAGMKREEASPNPKRIEADGGKLTKEYKKEVQDKVDKNTKILFSELDDVMEAFNTFKSKYQDMMKNEGKRRQDEDALRFGGRWKKIGSLYNKVNDMMVSLKKLKLND